MIIGIITSTALPVSGLSTGEVANPEVVTENSGERSKCKIGSEGDNEPINVPALILSIARTGVTVTAGLT